MHRSSEAELKDILKTLYHSQEISTTLVSHVVWDDETDAI